MGSPESRNSQIQRESKPNSLPSLHAAKRERERESAKNGINLEINAYLLSYKIFFSYILEIIILYTAVKN